MRQDFRTDELREAIERSCGIGPIGLARLPGRANSLNFVARPASGDKFVVKCSPKDHFEGFQRLLAHLDELEGSKAVRRVHRCAVEKFAHYNVVCLSWCEGERLFPDFLSRDELHLFLDDYLRFSHALQKATHVMPPMDPRGNMRHVQEWFHGPLADRFKAEIAALMRPVDIVYRADRLRVIHGDFHHGNFLFKDGRLAGVFDLEEFRYGYPADDIVRYFVCAAEHLRWFELARRTKVTAAFAEAVRYLPYGRHEWMVAINGLHLRMLESRAERGYGPLGTFDLRRKSRLYSALREVVEACAPGGNE